MHHHPRRLVDDDQGMRDTLSAIKEGQNNPAKKGKHYAKDFNEPTPENVRKLQNAQGVSVVELELRHGRWRNRRVRARNGDTDASTHSGCPTFSRCSAMSVASPRTTDT